MERFKKNINIYIVIIMVIILILGGKVYLHKKEREKYENNINKINDFYYKGEYDNAILEYQNINKTKDDAFINIDIAKIFSLKEDIKDSNENLELAIKNFKKDEYNFLHTKKQDINLNGEFFKKLVFINILNGEYDVAVKNGEEGFVQSKDYKPLKNTMILAYLLDNKKDEAYNLLKDYKLHEKSLDELLNYASIKIILKEYDEALVSLKKAWDLDNFDTRIYDILEREKDDTKIFIQKIEDLSSKDKEDMAYKMWLSKLYSLTKEDSTKSLKLLEELETRYSDNIMLNIIKISALYNNSKKEDAFNIMENLLKKYSDDFRVCHKAAWLYLNKKEYDKAFMYCKKSMEQNNSYIDNYGFLMPEIVLSQNKVNEAEPYFIDALQKEPYNFHILINYGEYIMNYKKDFNKALKIFELCKKIRPDDSRVFYDISLLNLKENDKDGAQNNLKKAIQLNGDVSKYYRTLGTIYLQNGLNEEALNQMRRAYFTDKYDILNLNNIGVYYISIEGNLEKGLGNIKSAYDSLDNSYDDYTKENIQKNYEIAKKMYENIKDGNINVPDFSIFY